MYAGVLDDAMRQYGLQELSNEVELDLQFRWVLGCIVILHNAVSVTPLARLSGLDPVPVFLTLLLFVP